MSQCRGDIPISTKIDKSMKDFIDQEIYRCGINRSEVIRRILDEYRDSHEGNLECPECGQKIALDIKTDK